MSRPRVALAHDNLAARAGGERVIAALADAWSEAEVHTMMHDTAATFGQIDPGRVQSSWINRIVPLRSRYRATIPVAALDWSARTIDADVTICSTSGLSHHVRTTGTKVVYCHTPARWIHDADTYMAGYGPAVKAAAALLRRPLGELDRRAMRSADRVLANSHQIAHEIDEVYGIEATVVAPCSTLDLDGPIAPIADVEPGFFVAPVRPLAYKRLDVLLAAARARPTERFVHIGDGPNRKDLLATAPPNMVSVGAVSDDQLRWAYRNAKAAVMTCAEDFGLVPLEAAAHGLVTVAPDARGLRDHDPDTIVSYEFASVDALIAALDDVPEPTRLVDAERLGRSRFIAAIEEALQ